MSDRQTVDPKRTGVRARHLPDYPEPMDDAARHYGQPGDIVLGPWEGHISIACPGCGLFAGITINPKSRTHWTVTGGSETDVAALSLSPSILRYCCGWHGFLRNGVFESC